MRLIEMWNWVLSLPQVSEGDIISRAQIIYGCSYQTAKDYANVIFLWLQSELSENRVDPHSEIPVCPRCGVPLEYDGSQDGYHWYVCREHLFEEYRLTIRY